MSRLVRMKSSRQPDVKAALDKFEPSEIHFLYKTFKDLAKRSPDTTIDKETFLAYFPLPGIVGHQLFTVFDKKKNGVIDYGEFMMGMALITRGNSEEKAGVLFQIFNLAQDEGISRTEMRTILKTSLTSAEKILGAVDSVIDDLDELSLETQEINHNVEEYIEEAFKGAPPEKKLMFEEFRDWIRAHPDICESLLEAPALTTHERKLTAHRSNRGIHGAMKGYLVGKSHATVKLKEFTTRYYILHEDYLYKYENESAKKPLGAYYLPGAFIDSIDEKVLSTGGSKKLSVGIGLNSLGDKKNSESVSGSSSNENNDINTAKDPKSPASTPNVMKSPKNTPSSGAATPKFPPGKGRGISITWHDGRHTRYLFTESEEEQKNWVKALKAATKMLDIKDFFDVEEEPTVGKGGFASIYKAKEKATGKYYAVKVVNKQGLHPLEREGLMSEIAILKLAKHPNIVQLHSVFDTKDTVALVLDLCLGGTVLGLMEEKGAMDEEEVKELARDICKGLVYIHSLGIVHRDLKPLNVLLSTPVRETRVAKLCDFGYSKFVRDTDKLRDPAGTFKYWAPEMISQGANHNKPVDLWVVGVIIYRALTGNHPFVDKDDKGLIKKMMNGTIERSSPEYLALSPEARSFLDGLFVVKPEKRMTAEEALAHPFLLEKVQPGVKSLNFVLASASTSADSKAPNSTPVLPSRGTKPASTSASGSPPES